MTVAFNPSPDKLAFDSKRIQIAFVHVGKCAGESILSEISRLPEAIFRVSEFHVFDSNVKIRNLIHNDREHIFYLIARRDPMSRFVSAFNWDKYNLFLKGQTFDRVHNAFTKFNTPDELALALSSEDQEEKSLAELLSRYGHMGMGQSWYTPVEILNNLPTDRTIVLDVETLKSDLILFLSSAGLRVDSDEWSPKNLKSNYGHDYANRQELFQSELSEKARLNLSSMLERDYKVYSLLSGIKANMTTATDSLQRLRTMPRKKEPKANFQAAKSENEGMKTTAPDTYSKVIENVRRPWIESSYYRDAEKWTYIFWDEKSQFRPLFDLIPKNSVIELACGHGRHAAVAASLVGHLTLVDVIEENLTVCRERLREFSNVDFKLGDGIRFPETADSSVDAVYCYDAMVHFPPEIVGTYLNDTARILRKGGRALFHHSNYEAGKGQNWTENPHARNYMTADLFAELAVNAGLSVIEQRIIPWGKIPRLDGITLVERPTA